MKRNNKEKKMRNYEKRHIKIPRKGSPNSALNHTKI